MLDKSQTTKYILYTRKSTESEDRQTLSLNDQKRELEELAKRENLTIVKSFAGSEAGESQSAHKRGRPIFQQVIDLIESGKANGLLVWHPNRIARNAYDGGLVITLLDEKKLLEVKTPNRAFKNTPDDKFFLQLEFGMAKKSSDDNGEAVNRGLRTKLQQGWFPSYAPLGYQNTKNFEEKGQNKILVDPERFSMVRKMWDLLLTGNYSPAQIHKLVTNEWGLRTRGGKHRTSKPPARSAIYNIFTNPFYYGWFEYGRPKQLYKGNHEPMITEDEFDLAQKILGKKGKPRAKTHRFAFTGLMRCGSCGAMITAEEKIKKQKNGNLHYYVYYRCTKRKDENCPERTIELKELNKQIDAQLDRLNISEKFNKWAIKYLHELRQNEAASNEQIFEGKQKALIQVRRQLDNLLLRFTSPENADGKLITDLEFQSLKNRFIKERTALESDLKAQGKAVDGWLELSERTFNFARYAHLHFSNGDLETRRTVLACIGSHLVIKDQKLHVELRKVFNFITENKEVAENELVQVRTSENAEKQKGTIALEQMVPVWRRV